MVAIGIIITVVGMSRQAKEAKKKQDAEKAMSLLDNKDEFKKFLDYDNSSKPRPQQSSTAQPTQRPAQTQSSQYRSQPAQTASKQQMTAELQQRLVELKRMQAERNAAKANVIVNSAHHDDHCDVSNHDSGDKYRVEYVPTMNSIGGKSTEGCEDHYNVRYVKIDEVEEKELELTALQKAIVYGEVINEPAFKRPLRGGRLR